MSLDRPSCSDCELEIIENIWTNVLLNWINNCVKPKMKIKEWCFWILPEITNKYRDEICVDDLDRSLLCSDDVESFLRNKYPILRLRYISEDTNMPRKVYIMASVLLYHCCVAAGSDIVERDIYTKLSKENQEIILRFCESLNDMDVTINNVDVAIKSACEEAAMLSYNLHKQQTKEQPTGSATDYYVESLKSIDYSERDAIPKRNEPKKQSLKFKSSMTVMSSSLFDDSSISLDQNNQEMIDSVPVKMLSEECKDTWNNGDMAVFAVEGVGRTEESGQRESFKEMTGDDLGLRCQPDCSCTRCIGDDGPYCGDPGNSMEYCDGRERVQTKSNPLQSTVWLKYTGIFIAFFLLILVLSLCVIPFSSKKADFTLKMKEDIDVFSFLVNGTWECRNNVCERMHQSSKNNTNIYRSYSRCTLLCAEPQLWPYPVGYTRFSKEIVVITTNKLEYKFNVVPSDEIRQYLGEAFKYFLMELAALERIDAKSDKNDFRTKKINIEIVIKDDEDPKLRLDTDESYALKIESHVSKVQIKVKSSSFCGARNGLETLTQLILLDKYSGHLITLSEVVIRDAPAYKYRGLMIDTGRNYIPVTDLMRTLDGMAMCKLNTFHWRISDAASFPLVLDKMPELYQYGAYDKSMVYTRDDIKTVVHRAGIRGIRVVIEVALPGPVGRAWSWSPDAKCQNNNDLPNGSTCNVLCLRLNMSDTVFYYLQMIFTEILNLTGVEDVYHISDGIFSLANCYSIINERDGFLDKVLERLMRANKGFLPKLPIIWYTSHLSKDRERRGWERLGIQLYNWPQNPSNEAFSKYKVIHSSKWDLSCETSKQRCQKYRTWQEMYNWNSWRSLEVFTVEGGEAVLWTDMVDSGNLDYHLWPRAAVVSERLWSDVVANVSVNRGVYVRLDNHRWRMQLRGIEVQPIWMLWCSFNPGQCLNRL